MTAGAGLRVRTAAECVVLDDGAVAWRSCVRLTQEPNVDEEWLSNATYATKALALQAARERADQIMASMQRMGAAVVCTHCRHLAHLDVCACGCPARTPL